MKSNIDSTKLLNEIATEQIVEEVNKNFAYKTSKGFFIYFINNISLENALIKELIKSIQNGIPEGTKVECSQFLFTRTKGNVLITVAFDMQPTKILIEKFEISISNIKKLQKMK